MAGAPCGHAATEAGCYWCAFALRNPRYARLWNLAPSAPIAPPPCRHRGDATGEQVGCSTCGRGVRLKLFACAVHQRCTLQTPAPGVGCCKGCPDLAPPLEAPAVSVRPPRTVPWAYGVTCVPQRRRTLLPRTLASLAAAGFDRPRLFVDGASNPQDWGADFGTADVTARWPPAGAWGNWILALWELYLRQPQAERFALFQDDLVCVKGLRRYLDLRPWPEPGYANLFAYLHNDREIQGRPPGWHEGATIAGAPLAGKPPQKGPGALALCFTRQAVVTLLSSRHVATKPQGAINPERNIDGAVVTAMNEAGWREFVHAPSLVQHTGADSVISPGKSGQARQAATFPGEAFDAGSLLREGVPCG